jgi:hypothetical protein
MAARLTIVDSLCRSYIEHCSSPDVHLITCVECTALQAEYCSCLDVQYLLVNILHVINVSYPTVEATIVIE